MVHLGREDLLVIVGATIEGLLSIPSLLPYFEQVWSISNIFTAPWSKQRPADEVEEVRGTSAPPPSVLNTGPSPWLYFNLLVTQSQVGRMAGWQCSAHLTRPALPCAYLPC